jgi:hypothetical protein
MMEKHGEIASTFHPQPSTMPFASASASALSQVLSLVSPF